MEVKILPFSLEHTIEIIPISEIEIGKNFINKDYFTFYLNNPNAKGIVALADEEVVGFYFFQWCHPDEINKYIFTEKQWLNRYFNNVNLVGYRNLMAVKNEFRSKGVGRELVDFSMRELRKKTKTIACVVWKSPNSISIEKLLKNYGFNSKRVITNYWEKDSIRRNYECAVCGTPPCKCTAEIFISENL